MNFWSRSLDIFRERALLFLARVSFNSFLNLFRISLFRLKLLVSIIEWNLSVCVSRVDNSLAWSLVNSLFLLGGEGFNIFLSRRESL